MNWIRIIFVFFFIKSNPNQYIYKGVGLSSVNRLEYTTIYNF